jgi:hypothetical protein
MNRHDAEESVAARFTRAMNASTSPLGKYSDLVIASALAGLVLVVGLYLVRRASGTGPVYAVLAAAALPIAISWAIAASLRRAREEVIAWLETLPFDVINLNALLAGGADRFEVVFARGASLPDRATLQPRLERVHEDVLLLKTAPEHRALEIQLGVIDVKRLPLLRQHERWRRFVTVVGQVLVPLSAGAPITAVNIV